MMTRSRIQSGVSYRNRFTGDKFKNALKIAKAAITVTFLVVNIVLVCLVYFGIITLEELSVESGIFLLFVVLIFNIH